MLDHKKATFRPVVIVGNYPLDGQESMGRFTALLAKNLSERGITYEVISPRPILGGMMGRYRFSGLPKWLGYFDKYVLFGRELSRRSKQGWQIHITDHSNAMYAQRGRGDIVTCHDLLAVRGALGESTDCPAGFTGRILQKWILRGLDRAGVICCVSHETAKDVRRLLPHRKRDKTQVVPNALNYPFGGQPEQESRKRLRGLGIDEGSDFVLHVGSNLARKNKGAVLKAVAQAGDRFDGKIVFAGPELSESLRKLAKELGLSDRVYEIIKPTNEDLEALYAGARALVFPSRWEGFGWPIIEAQACRCPVICSNQSALPEIAGEGAILCPPDKSSAWAESIVELGLAVNRAAAIEAGLRNVANYSQNSMMNGYLDAYSFVTMNSHRDR